jgi:transposase-like protein
VREYLHTICKNDNLTEIQHYAKDHRNNIIRMAKDYGASIRQVSRLTGVSEGIIRKI